MEWWWWWCCCCCCWCCCCCCCCCCCLWWCPSDPASQVLIPMAIGHLFETAGTLGRLEPDGRHGWSSTYPTTSGSLVRGVLVTRSMDRHSRWTCRPFGCKRHCILDSMGIRWRCHVSWQAKYPCDPKARWGVVWLCRYVWMLERHAGQTTHDDIVNSPQSSRQSFGFRNEWNQRSARTYSPTFVG